MVLGVVLVVLEVVLVVLGVVLVVLHGAQRQCSEQMFGTDVRNRQCSEQCSSLKTSHPLFWKLIINHPDLQDPEQELLSEQITVIVCGLELCCNFEQVVFARTTTYSYEAKTP